MANEIAQGRKITVFSTQTNETNHVTSAATTWGELQRDLSNKNISYSNMKIVVKENRTTLEDAQAQIPQGDFTLFMFPVKVKSGLSLI